MSIEQERVVQERVQFDLDIGGPLRWVAKQTWEVCIPISHWSHDEDCFLWERRTEWHVERVRGAAVAGVPQGQKGLLRRNAMRKDHESIMWYAGKFAKAAHPGCGLSDIEDLVLKRVLCVFSKLPVRMIVTVDTDGVSIWVHLK